MDFSETEEQALLRRSVAALAARYGQAYFLAKARAGEKTHELWDEVGRLGYLGVAVPEKYGGGGHPVVGAVSLGPDRLEDARRIAGEIAAALKSG